MSSNGPVRENVLVSACLGGRRCRYDGKDKLNPALIESFSEKNVIFYCPEESGGLPTPREKALIVEGDGAGVLDGTGKVVTESGRDVTREFLDGARGALELALSGNIRVAYLKSDSPSCGCGRIKDFRGARPGDGVTASLLKRNGIVVRAVD